MKTIFSLFLGFHSINVPSEWGLPSGKISGDPSAVSIQLMSPASGDTDGSLLKLVIVTEFPFN